MSLLIGDDLDLQGLQIENARLHNLVADPGILTDGQVWINTSDKVARVYDGAAVRDLFALDDNFHTLTEVTSAEDNDEVLISDSSDVYRYKRIKKSNFLAGSGAIPNAYYRIIAQSGVANLDATGADDIAIRGDNTILYSVGATAGNQTLTIDWKTQYANHVLAGPASGGPAKPTFRSLNDNDLPVSYNPTAWDAAYAHSLITSGNPHNVDIISIGGEPLLGNPPTDGYILSSTAAGVRLWVNPNLLGGQALSALITSPSGTEDGYSVVWDDGNNQFTLVNVTGSTGVTISGTPVAEQLAVWASASSIEGDANLTWNGTNLVINVSAPDLLVLSAGITALTHQSDSTSIILQSVYTNTVADGAKHSVSRYGGSYSSPAAAPTDAIIFAFEGTVYNGSSAVDAASMVVQVDGAFSGSSFDAKFVWSLHDGASAIATRLTLNPDGLEYSVDHSAAQAANDRWIPDKAYVDAAVAAAGSSYWSRTGTDLFPATVGDDILLAVSTETIKWGDGDTYFRETSDDVFKLIVGGFDCMTWGTASVITSRDILPSSGGTIDLGSATYYYQLGYFYTIYLGGGSALSITKNGLNEMVFQDGVVGPYTLSDLAAGAGSGYVDVSGTPAVNQIAVFVDADTIKGDSNLTWNGSILGVTGAINVDSISDKTGSGINIEGIVINTQVINIPVTNGGVAFGDADTYIYESTDDVLDFWVGGALRFRILTTQAQFGVHVNPGTTKTYNLGTSSYFWDDAFVDTLYIDNTGAKIDYDGTELTFTDPYNGTLKLSDLISSVGASIYGSPTAGMVSYFYSTTAITGSSDLAWDGSVLTVANKVRATDSVYAGTRVNPFDSSLGASITIGLDSASQCAGLELYGDFITNYPIGSITFHNLESSAFTKIIAAIHGVRDNHNNAGEIQIWVADDAATMMYSHVAKHDLLSWYIENSSLMQLNATQLILGSNSASTFALNFNTTASYDWSLLANGSTNFQLKYYNDPIITLTSSMVTLNKSTRIPTLGGSGTRLVTTDNDGDLGAVSIVDVSGKIGRVLHASSSNSTFTSSYPISLGGVSNADYEGAANGSRVFRFFLTGEYGSDGGAPKVHVTLYLGSTILALEDCGDSGLDDSDFRVEIYASAISTTQSMITYIVAYGKQNVSGDFDNGYFKHFGPVTHGVGNGLYVKLQVYDGTTNSYVKLNHAYAEVLEA